MNNQRIIDQNKRADNCNRGINHYVCMPCAIEYRTTEPEEQPTSFHFGACFICKKTKEVANSRNLFGFKSL